MPQKPGEPSDSIASPPTQGERPEGPLPPSTKPKYNLSGYPANTQQGYIDGCETAKNSGLETINIVWDGTMDLRFAKLKNSFY